MQQSLQQSLQQSKNIVLLVARLLMCSLFIWDGVLQLRNPDAAAHYFESLHVPLSTVAVWPSVALHLLAGAAILIGFKTRWAAAVLALFCLATAFGVHLPAGDLDNMTHFYKNLVMAGGFLYVMSFGAGAFSVDREAA
jgi:putative oxidoreductase